MTISTFTLSIDARCTLANAYVAACVANTAGDQDDEAGVDLLGRALDLATEVGRADPFAQTNVLLSGETWLAEAWRTGQQERREEVENLLSSGDAFDEDLIEYSSPLQLVDIDADTFIRAHPAVYQPVFSSRESGYVLSAYPELGCFPASYRHGVWAVARDKGLQLSDDDLSVLRRRPMPAPMSCWVQGDN